MQEAQLVVFRSACKSSSGLAPVVYGGLPRLYMVACPGCMVTRNPSPFSLCRSDTSHMRHDKQGLCAASASKSPPFLVNSSQTSGQTSQTSASARPHLGPQIPDCMHAGSTSRGLRSPSAAGSRLVSVRDPRASIKYCGLWSRRVTVRSSKEDCTAVLPAVWRTT